MRIFYDRKGMNGKERKTMSMSNPKKYFLKSYKAE